MADLEFGSATHMGCVRDLNEDAVLATRTVFIVADGMGGHAAGEVAAALALAHLGTLDERDDLRPEDVVVAIGDANEAILSSMARHEENTGMGTTVSGLCLGTVAGSAHWFVFNVGDSRVYRFADGVLTRVTVDHSEVEELVAAGRITADEARSHPRRNVVTRSLGTTPAPTADMWVLPAMPGDCFLVCSDGLTVEVVDDDIAIALRQAAQPQQAADALVRLAIEAGGRDNVSAVVVRLRADTAHGSADVATAPRASLTGDA
jgi:serine/threonine protein phosphatase PrpC